MVQPREIRADKAHWSEVARGVLPPSVVQHWDARAQVIAQFIRPGERVLDLGAGDQKLRKHLPPSCTYVPVDIASDHPDTFIVDFKNEFRLPDGHFDVVVSAGFIEHLPEWDVFMRQLVTHLPGAYFVFTYYLAKQWPFPRPSTVDEVQRGFITHVAWLREIARFHNQSLFTGVLSADADHQQMLMPVVTLNQAMAPIPKPRKSFLERRLRMLTRIVGTGRRKE